MPLYVDEYVIEKPGVPAAEFRAWPEAGVTEHSQSVVREVPDGSAWQDELRPYARQPVGYWNGSSLFSEGPC